MHTASPLVVAGRARGVIWALGALALLALPLASSADTIRVGGTGTMTRAVAVPAEAYRARVPDANVQTVAEQRRVKVLALDGVTPTLAALASGAYRHATTIDLVHRASPPPDVQGFLSLATSEAARDILAPIGFQVARAPR